ncbi:MAG: glycosyltransferase, partial [Chloroflexota bacterium]
EDAIEQGVTGLLISQQHIAAELPAVLVDLLRNPEKRAAMGAAGRSRAQQFTWARTAQQVLAAYEHALSG